MNQVVGLALLGLVTVLALPQLRLHRVIVPLLHRGGQLLLVGCILVTATAVVEPRIIGEVLQRAEPSLPEVIRLVESVPLPGQLLLAAATLLVLLAPVSAYREMQRNQANDNSSLDVTPANSASGKQSPGPASVGLNGGLGASYGTAPVREELQVILGRMKNAGTAR